MRQPLRPAAAALVVLTLAFVTLRPGAHAPLAAPESAWTGIPQVSADSILASARDLAGETGIGPRSRFAPRPTTGNYALYLRDRLDAVLRPMGGYAVLEPFDPGFTYSGPHTLRNPYTNVVGILPGRLGAAAPGFFMMGGHFDATSMRDALTDTAWDPFTHDAPGADDNASGVSAILEALRVAAARGIRPEADVHIAFFDGEEMQMVEDQRFLLGSKVLADTTRAIQDAGGDRLYAFINADMIAYNPRRDSLVVLSNISSRWLATQILDVHESGGYAAGLQVERLVQGLTFSDHGPFWAEGFDAVMLLESTDVETHAPHYHHAIDTVDNTYSRGGSQAALTADLFVGMLDEWSRTGPDSLVVTDEDILVQFGNAVDLASVDLDDEVTVLVGLTNRGGTRRTPVSVTLDIQTLDREFVRTLGTQQITELIPAGARVRVRFPWSPMAGEQGVVRLAVSLTPTTGAIASRLEAVRGGAREVQAAFVYPNPTRDPESAMLAYEMSQDGSIRITVVGIDAVPLAELDLPYDKAVRAPGTVAGLSRVPLRDVLAGTKLAPGLYLLRVEVFKPEGGSADVSVAKFVVLR